MTGTNVMAKYDNCPILACQQDQDCKQRMACLAQEYGDWQKPMGINFVDKADAWDTLVKSKSAYRDAVLEEAAQECDELAEVAMTDEFSVGGCIVTKIAAKVLAANIRALKKGPGNE